MSTLSTQTLNFKVYLPKKGDIIEVAGRVYTVSHVDRTKRGVFRALVNDSNQNSRMMLLSEPEWKVNSRSIEATPGVE